MYQTLKLYYYIKAKMCRVQWNAEIGTFGFQTAQKSRHKLVRISNVNFCPKTKQFRSDFRQQKARPLYIYINNI